MSQEKHMLGTKKAYEKKAKIDASKWNYQIEVYLNLTTSDR